MSGIKLCGAPYSREGSITISTTPSDSSTLANAICRVLEDAELLSGLATNAKGLVSRYAIEDAERELPQRYSSQIVDPYYGG
jgi:hypothetical protein